MAGTVAIAAKAALLGESSVLAGLSGMEDVKVAYNATTEPREIVFGAGIGGPVNLAAMRGGGSNRVRREEQLTLTLVIRVHKMGQRTTEAAETRAAAISTIIEDYIAANPTLGGVTNLKLASVANVDIDGWLNDDSAIAQVTLQIALHSFLA